MADGYIMYIEEEMNDPVEIERVVREAEFNYARDVHDLNRKKHKKSIDTSG